MGLEKQKILDGGFSANYIKIESVTSESDGSGYLELFFYKNQGAAKTGRKKGYNMGVKISSGFDDVTLSALGVSPQKQGYLKLKEPRPIELDPINNPGVMTETNWFADAADVLEEGQ